MQKLNPIFQEILDDQQKNDPLKGQAKGGLAKELFSPESLLMLLLTHGLRSMIPFFKELLALGFTALKLKQQDIANQLKAYAKEKELDYHKAEKAANKIAGKLAKHATQEVIDAIEEGVKDEK
ncbi:MAG: hypothetical protein R8G66_09230 [Cytophagales bacterium]|nr:hypothetical protein [Cytophagales bacterium]